MALELDDFKGFFAATHSGALPFPWQIRLVDQLLTSGEWPEEIVAPTSAGKTAVIDAHVFAVAAMASGAGTVVPRRLALVVPRRTLVDNQYDHARHVASILRTPRTAMPPPLRQVAEALGSLRWDKAPDVGADPVGPLVVARLRGGLPPPREWRNDPAACAVLSCTPDMWGSRLLLRGYGSSQWAWPREAGLLALDSVVVVDEAHLCRQLLVAARSVAALQQRARERIDVPTLQVVAATATPVSAGSSRLGLADDDLADRELARRLQTPKPVELMSLPEWPPRKTDTTTLLSARAAVAERIAEKAVELRRCYGPTVVVFVNTVKMSTIVTDKIRHLEVNGKPLNVVLVCGRLRDHDVQHLRIEYPGLFTLDGNREVDVLVTTQSLEVGVDIDASAGVSELASGGALTQRAGRVNRLGRRPDTRFVVVGPTDDSVFHPAKGECPASGPYPADDLVRALVWLRQRTHDPAGLSPLTLVSDPPPPATPRRTLYQRVEVADSWWWARSSDSLDPRPELELWLADDLATPIPEVGVIVRHAVPEESDQAVALLRALPPQAHEVCPVLLGDAQAILEKATEPGKDWGTVLVVHEHDVNAVIEGNPPVLRGGDVLVLDARARTFTLGVPNRDGTESVTDVLEAKVAPGRGDVFLRVDEASWPGTASSVLDRCARTLEDGSDTRRARDALANLLGAYTERSPMVHLAARLLREKIKNCDVITQYEGERLVRFMVADQRRAVSDDGACQTWTPSDDPPLLGEHARAVADRCRYLARGIGLGEKMEGLLALAGQHHDDGKADLRFQVRLGKRENDPLLAKGRQVSATRGEASSVLPARWRHEQLSVLEAWAEIATLSPAERDLVGRLIGTSHGHGRPSFPHASHELGMPDKHQALAEEMFDEGRWDEIIEQTDRRLGVWACAFLEAVLRAADGQVSGEGS